MLPDVQVVIIQEHRTVGGNRVRELEFGADDIVDGLEGFEMLLADRGQDTVFRPHQFADFTDIAGILRSHLHDKDLVIRAQLLPDGAHYAHRGVVAFRGHQNVVL